MKKVKKDKSVNKPRTMLDQEVGSMEDIKTNEDFNNEHPNHDENGLLTGNSGREDKNPKIKLKSKEK